MWFLIALWVLLVLGHALRFRFGFLGWACCLGLVLLVYRVDLCSF